MENSSGGLLKLSFESVAPDPNQPRKYIDGKKILDLANSFNAQGQLQPILVRNNPDYTSDNGLPKYLIIAGERRWTAGKLSNLGFIEAVCKNVNSVSAAQLMENDDRVSLNPIERAEKLQSRIEELEAKNTPSPKKVVAEENGKSQAWVSKSLKIMALDDEIRQLARVGDVTDIPTLTKLNKCRTPKRLEAFAEIKAGTFNSKTFFKRKRTIVTDEIVGDISPKIKVKVKKSNYSLRLEIAPLITLMDRSGFLSEVRISTTSLRSMEDNSFKGVFKQFSQWVAL